MGVGVTKIKVERDNINYIIKLWDINDQKQMTKSILQYIYKADYVCSVYAINSKSSFEKISFWLEIVKEANNQKLKIVLIGNICDLEGQRVISKEEGYTKAKKLQITFLRCLLKKKKPS